MKNLENEKFTMQAMMAFDRRNVCHAVSHSRHSVSRGGYSANETTNQERLAVEADRRKRYEQTNSNDSIRVLRF